MIRVIDSCYIKYGCMRDNNRSSVGFDDHKQCEKVEGIEAVEQDLSYFTVYFLLSLECTRTVRYTCVLGRKWQNKDHLQLFCNKKQCFVINVLNNKTIILLSLVNIPCF